MPVRGEIPEKGNGNDGYVCGGVPFALPCPCVPHLGHVIPQDCMWVILEEPCMAPNSALFPCSVPSLGSRIDHELPFGSEEAFSLVRVIDKNTHFENFGKSTKGSTITAFISTHSLHIFFTLSSCSMASHSFEMTLESLSFLPVRYVHFEHLYPHHSYLRMYLYIYL